MSLFAALLPALIGGLVGMDANKKAKSSADKAANRGRALEDRQVALFDELLKMVQGADQSGQFNPEEYIKQLETDTAKYEARDAGNLAGALRVAGYRPGDTEIGKRLDAVKTNYRSQLDTQRTNLRRGLFSDRLNAYQSVNPGYLNAGISGAQRSEAMGMAQQQNPAALFASIMPLLQGGNNNSPQKNPFTFLGNQGFGIGR